jgi:hypothetical protein
MKNSKAASYYHEYLINIAPKLSSLLLIFGPTTKIFNDDNKREEKFVFFLTHFSLSRVRHRIQKAINSVSVIPMTAYLPIDYQKLSFLCFINGLSCCTMIK